MFYSGPTSGSLIPQSRSRSGAGEKPRLLAKRIGGGNVYPALLVLTGQCGVRPQVAGGSLAMYRPFPGSEMEPRDPVLRYWRRCAKIRNWRSWSTGNHS